MKSAAAWRTIEELFCPCCRAKRALESIKEYATGAGKDLSADHLNAWIAGYTQRHLETTVEEPRPLCTACNATRSKS